MIIQDIQGKYGENKEGKFENWKMNREIGMDMYEYRWICGYEDILVLVYRYSGIDIGMMGKEGNDKDISIEDRKGWMRGRGVWGRGKFDYKRDALA